MRCRCPHSSLCNLPSPRQIHHPTPLPPTLKMKSFFVLAAATMVALTSAADCNIAALAPLLSDPNVKKCGADTGLAPPVPPAADVLPKLCGNKACLAALATVKAMNVGDCSVGPIKLETDFLNPIEKYCAAQAPAPAPPAAAPSSAPSPATPSAKPAAPSTPGTPAASTPAATSKPVC